jgi:hypothetical protein
MFMAVLKSDDGKHMLIDCDCGCNQGIRFVVEPDESVDNYIFFMTYTSGNFYRDQCDSIWRVVYKKMKKIWAIIRNKDFYYSDITMTKSDFEKFKEYINSIK